jgi:hypothetical protein
MATGRKENYNLINEYNIIYLYENEKCALIKRVMFLTIITVNNIACRGRTIHWGDFEKAEGKKIIIKVTGARFLSRGIVLFFLLTLTLTLTLTQTIYIIFLTILPSLFYS